jgi:hypothetical protein
VTEKRKALLPGPFFAGVCRFDSDERERYFFFAAVFFFAGAFFFAFDATFFVVAFFIVVFFFAIAIETSSLKASELWEPLVEK